MNREIERLLDISNTARTNPAMITAEDVSFVSKTVKSSNEKVAEQAYATVGLIGSNRPEKIMHLIEYSGTGSFGDW